MNTENLNVRLAQAIHDAHLAARAAVADARTSIEDAIQRSAEVGLLIEEAKSIHHAHFPAWLRNHVQSLPVAQAEVYYSVHKVRSKRQCKEIDHRQMKLIGILPEEGLSEQGGSSTAQRADHSRWVKWCGHVVSHFREVEEKRPIEQWADFERRALVDALAPIVELWKKAHGLDVGQT